MSKVEVPGAKSTQEGWTPPREDGQKDPVGKTDTGDTMKRIPGFAPTQHPEKFVRFYESITKKLG